VTTGDPKDLPVIGKQMATLSHQLHVAQLKHDGEASAEPVPASAETPAVNPSPEPPVGQQKHVEETQAAPPANPAIAAEPPAANPSPEPAGMK
jgi:hypothetical protein